MTQQPPPPAAPLAHFSVKAEPPSLPVEGRAFHQFYRTPRFRWWHPLVALLLLVFLFLVGSVIAVLPAIAYDVAVGNTAMDDITAIMSKVTPAVFLANNVSLGFAIPIAWLVQYAIFKQKPKWLSSVVGGFRWGWALRCLAVVIPVYAVMAVFEYVVSPPADVMMRPYTITMIVGILITTPFQAAGEEYGTRGIIFRSVSAWFRHEKVALAVGMLVSGLVFMGLHGAADMWLNAFYLTFGAVAAWLAYRTGGLEAPIILHVVNNLVAEMFLPFTDFSNMFDRSVGTASGADLAPIVLTLVAVVALIELQVRRAKPVNRTAPGAELQASPGVTASA